MSPWAVGFLEKGLSIALQIPNQGWLGFFVPLNVRSLRIYWLGQACSLIGMWLQVTAMGILVYELSHGSGTAVGLLAALNAAPFLLGGMALGALGDRFDRRKLLLVVQLVQITVAVLLCFLSWGGMLELWHLYVASLLLGGMQCVAFPSQQAFVGDLSPKGMLLKSVGMYSLVFNICRSVGPPLGGYVIAALGANYAFGLNALCCIPLVGCLMLLGGMYAPERVERQAGVAGQSSSGLVIVWRDKRLRMILISALVQNLLGQSLYQIVPALTYGNPSATGSLLGAVGAGAVSSILFVMPFLRYSSRIGLNLSCGTLWMGAMFAVAGLVPVLHVQMVCFFLAGVATSALFVTTSSTVQLLSPGNHRSRILGLFTIVTIGAQPLAALGWGALLDAIGVPVMLVSVGIVEVIISVGMLLVPFWPRWKMEEQGN